MLGEIAFFGDLEVAGFYEHFCFREGGERHIHTANVNAKVISALSVWIQSNLNSFHQNLAPNFVNHIASNTTNFEINQELLISPFYIQFHVIGKVMVMTGHHEMTNRYFDQGRARAIWERLKLKDCPK